MLNFEEVKRIRIVDVIARYGVRLRFKGEWASAPCPLPTHKSGDKGRSFTINLEQNYWRCFSATCNDNNGGKKGGDVINFVALMDNCRERDAAQKIAEWFSLNCNKKPPLIIGAAAPKKELALEKPIPAKDCQNLTSPSDSGKGYIASLDSWFDEVFRIGPELREDEFWKKCRNAVKGKCIESYKNGKAARA